MKHYISLITLLIILLNFGGCKEHSGKPNQKDLENCESGISKAELDAEKGKYELLSYGMPSYDDWDFQEFYENFIEKKYGIEIGNAGCEIFEESECYSKKMREIIFKKFGENIFEKAKSEANVEYKIDVQNKINNDFVFSKVDKTPTFKNGKDKLTSYLSENINNPKDLEGRIIIFFVVEKNGKINDVKIKKGLSIDYDKEIIEVFTKMTNWNPGIHFGQKVRVRIAIPLEFKKKNKN